MSREDAQLRKALDAGLHSFDQQERPLPGIESSANRMALIEQLIESVHRVEYVFLIRKRKLSPLRADPSSDLFHPLKAAIVHERQGQTDEAFWLVFLFVHFGKNLNTGWRLARDIYGCLGGGPHWNWARTSADPKGFRQWLKKHQAALQGGDGVPRHFGNHRKYESLDATSPRGTGAAVESYVRWVQSHGTHQMLVSEAQQQAAGDSRKTFSYLYRSMDAVTRFGRTAKFDYLTMVGKLGLAAIEPGSTFMQGATGPLKGARLLFGEKAAHAKTLDVWLVKLEAHLNLNFGMQVLEDAICNWQKSPAKFESFRG